MDKLALMLRKRYIFALLLIALLVIASNIGTQFFIDTQIHDSRIINLAGKQRMLSQKITKTIYQLPFAETEIEKHKMLSSLEESVALWEKTHKGLQFGDQELQLPGNNPNTIQTLFDAIQQEHESMLAAAKKIIEIGENDQGYEMLMKTLRNTIRDNETDFLKGMDEIVFSYDDLARIKVEKILRIERILLGLTLITLVLEALFIFRPAELLVNRSIKGLLINEKNLEDLFDTAPSMSVIISEKTKEVIRMNQIAMHFFDIQKDNKKNYYIYDFLEAVYLESLNQLATDKKVSQITPIEVVLSNLSRESTPMVMLASKLFFHNEEVLLINFSDISEQKKNEDILKALASTDGMTGLLNRRTGMIIFEKAFEAAKRRQAPIITCFMDLDGLKHVNDTYGHQEGDRFIKTLSKAILKNVRIEDIAFRYGGDEFVIIFNDCEALGVELIIERIKSDCLSFNNMIELPYKIDFSYGYTVWNDGPNMTIEELIEIADEKMYKDKQRKFPDRKR
jgi:diguanylate cyclase (GGDEF)-like protein